MSLAPVRIAPTSVTAIRPARMHAAHVRLTTDARPTEAGLTDARLTDARPTDARLTDTRLTRALAVRALAACVLLACALTAASLSASPALADSSATPFATPQHDVDILYAVPVPGATGTAGAVTQHLRVQAATGLQRIDPPSAGAFMITDGRTGRTTVVEPSLKLATTLPNTGTTLPPPGTRATGDYQRIDTATVAGNPCTDWRTRDLAGHDSVVCLTDDGMLLRIVQDGQVRAQAVRLDRAPQPDAVFAIPSGYTLTKAPNGHAAPGH